MSAPLVFGDGRACGLELMRFVEAGPMPETDRRRRVRLSLSLPIRVFHGRSMCPIESTTRNVSSDGFYFFIHENFAIGERIRCVLDLPSFQPGHRERYIRLDCRARVVRVETLGPSNYGIACAIEEYHVVHVHDDLSPSPV